jgi:excisionase family DNA binding protein
MSNEPIIKPLLSVSEAAILAGVNRNTMYKLLRQDIIPDAVIRPDGMQWLVRSAALRRWLDSPTA